MVAQGPNQYNNDAQHQQQLKIGKELHFQGYKDEQGQVHLKTSTNIWSMSLKEGPTQSK